MSDTNNSNRALNRTRTTHDAITGRPFRWNTTAEHRNADGTITIVPARRTTHGVLTLHPRRVQRDLLRELNQRETD